MPSSEAAERFPRIRGQRRRKAWDKAVTRELFRRYREQGDEEARDQLIENHLSLVHYLASKFKRSGEQLEDLVQVGTIGLIKAVDRFDPERGLEFTTYATPTITGEIKRHFRDKGWAVRVPRRLQELSTKVKAATDELTTELHRVPSVDEVAEYTGLSADDVLEAMESAGAYSSVSLESGGDDEEGAPSIIDRYAVMDPELAATDDAMLLESLFKDFTEREREILRMRYDDGLTQAQIAERLGVSQVQVSRLLRRTIERMRAKAQGEA